MKTLEFFIDESGDIARARSMNISGIAVLARSEQDRDAFHAEFFLALESEGFTSGVCDSVAANGIKPDQLADSISKPANFLPKRPEVDDWQGFMATVNRMAQLAELAAIRNHAEIAAFSLKFPTDSARRWIASDTVADHLLDRPYGERLKDVLELLLYETPWARQVTQIQDDCLIGVDLPTRTLNTNVEAFDQQEAQSLMWSEWGVQAWCDSDADTGQPQLVANTLEPSDGIEILTTVFNRRKGTGLVPNVERVRCCKLLNWSQWADWDTRPAPKPRNKRFWYFKNSPRPKQIHYLADLLANGIFNEQALETQKPYSQWFDRGFLLSNVAEGCADMWIRAARAFANGDRVAAMLEADRICAVPGHRKTETFRFFQQSARSWTGMLSGTELRELFQAIGKRAIRWHA